RPGQPAAKLNASAGTNWTEGMLQFDGAPIAEAVAQANRYSGRHILIEGNLETLRVTGAFRAGNTAALAKALAAAFHLSLRRTAGNDLILSHREAGAPAK